MLPLFMKVVSNDRDPLTTSIQWLLTQAFLLSEHSVGCHITLISIIATYDVLQRYTLTYAFTHPYR